MKVVPNDWHDDLHVIDRYDNYPDPFEGELFPDENEPDANLPDIPVVSWMKYFRSLKLLMTLGKIQKFSRTVSKNYKIFLGMIFGAPRKPKELGV